MLLLVFIVVFGGIVLKVVGDFEVMLNGLMVIMGDLDVVVVEMEKFKEVVKNLGFGF